MFADTSFIFALYRPQPDSSRAEQLVRRLAGPVLISSLVALEFRQSVRLQVFRFSSDRSQGFSRREAQGMLRAFDQNSAAGLFQIAPIEWSDVQSIAERISAGATATAGFRLLDILHVASALHLKENSFITFDRNQEKLARQQGLVIPR